MSAIASYVPIDRRQALASGVHLPEHAQGAVLFADVAGFTPLAEQLMQLLGSQRGAEELLVMLNQVYEALTAEVDRYRGSVINIAGDALTIWFATLPDERLDQAARRGASCALAMQAAMASLPPAQPAPALALKTTLVAGPVRRFLAGDPDLQVVEVLAGVALAELAAAAEQTRAGELVLGPSVAPLLAPLVSGALPRPLEGTPGTALRIAGLAEPAPPLPWPALPEQALSDADLRPWLLPPVYQRLHTGQGEFLTELRHTVALFLRFADLDYDHDPAAPRRLDAFVRWIQRVLARYEGWLMQVSLGDKGSYLYAAFGAPVAHGDDAARAAGAALELRQPPPDLADLAPLQIGLAAGRTRVGAVGGGTRTYSVMGDSVNLAARLMMAAAPGQVLLGPRLAALLGQQILFDPLPPLSLKGKARPVAAVALRGLLPARFHQQHASLPLIGRTHELAFLEQQLERAGHGQGSIVALTGEAGVGKSRLAAQLVRRAAQAGWLVLSAAAQATSTQIAYFAWRPIWQALLGLRAGLPADEQPAALEQALLAAGLAPQRLPLLAPLLGLALPDSDLTRGLDAKRRKELLEELLLECLRARLSPGPDGLATPLLLLLEDAHWFDALSLDLLSALAGAAGSLPLLLLLTWRAPDMPPPLLALLERLPHISEVPLGHLTAQETDLLITHHVALRYGPHQTIARPFAEAVIARAEGNPFYVEELIGYLADHAIAPDDPGALQALELPGSLTGLILSRIDRLTSEQQTMLKVASVIGRIFPLAWLWGVHPQIGPEARVRSDLDHTNTLGLTAPHRPDPDLSYLFRHALIQEVPYESLPFGLRVQLHERLAAWLEQRQDGDDLLDLLAYHYGRSANLPKQREYLRKAAQAAAARYASAAALQYYQRLLELLEPELQAEVYLAMGQIHQSASTWEAAERCYRTVFDLVDRQRAAGLWAQAQLGLGIALSRLGQIGAALPWLAQARALFEELGDLARGREALLNIAGVLWFTGDLDQAEQLIQTCLHMPETHSSPLALAHISLLSGNIAFSRQDYPAARDWWQRSLLLWQELGDVLREIHVYNNMVMAAYGEGQLEQARALADTCIDICTRIGARWEVAQVQTKLGLILVAQGAAAAACQIQAQNLIEAGRLHFPYTSDGCLIGLAQALQAADPGDEAQRGALLLIAAAQPILQIGRHGVYAQIAASVVERARQRLPPDLFEAAWAEGLGLGPAGVLPLARQLLAAAPTSGEHTDSAQ